MLSQRIFRYAKPAIRPLTYDTDVLYFGMECDTRHVTAVWTHSCVTRRQQCFSNYDTDDVHFGMECGNGRVTAAWTHSCVTRRRQCGCNYGTDDVHFGMECDNRRVTVAVRCDATSTMQQRHCTLTWNVVIDAWQRRGCSLYACLLYTSDAADE